MLLLVQVKKLQVQMLQKGPQVRHRQKEQKKPRQKQQGITLMQL